MRNLGILERPLLLAFSLNIVFAATVLLGGFSASIVSGTFFAIYLIVKTKKSEGLFIAFSYAIVFLLIFDSETFTYTGLKFRIWYLILLFGWFMVLARKAYAKKTPTFLRSWTSVFLFLFYALLSIFWLIIDPIDGKLSNIKYFLFTIGLIIYLGGTLATLDNNALKRFLSFLLGVASFVCFWGFIQFAMLQTPFAGKFMLHYFNIRPEAFFSETTWYGIYCLWGIIILSAGLDFGYFYAKYRFMYFFFFLGAILSLSRNVIIGIILFFLLKWFFSFLRMYWVRDRVSLKINLLIVLGLVAGILFVWYKIEGYQSIILDKMLLKDASGAVRFEAFRRSFQEIQQVWFTGAGYEWKQDQVTFTGTYLGSKSFNLFLMVAYIYGALGLLIFLGALTIFFVKYGYGTIAKTKFTYEYAFIILLIFIVMSMFAPLHQFPLGAMMVGVALGFSRIRNAKNCFVPSLRSFL